MRSRDGNQTFSLSVSSVIFLLCSLALDASEYLISYKYSVKDAILYNETLELSKAMQKCQGSVYDTLILDVAAHSDLKETLTTHNEDFIEYIHKLGLSVAHKEKTTNFQNKFTTILTLKTTCFKVDFNDNFVKISPLK